MSASVLVSLMVVIIAFVLFFFLSFRGVNLFLTVFACTVLVCLCTPDGLTSIFTTFLPSMGNMFQQFFLLYTIGGAFGFCLMESGLGDAMATHMIKIFGEKWIAVALFVITCLMMAGRRGLLPVRCPGHLPARTEKAEYVPEGGPGGHVRRRRLCGLRYPHWHAKRPEHRPNHLPGHHHHGRSRHQPGVYRLFRGVHRGLPDSPEQVPEGQGGGLCDLRGRP